MRRTLALGVVLLVAMTVGRVLTDRVPVGTVATKPFVRTGSVGHTMGLRYADLRVTKVRSAAFLDQLGTANAPGGHWLIVDATVVARGEPRRIAWAVLRGGDGRTYAPTTRGGCTNRSFGAPTGLAYHAMYCFDLPRGAIAGSTLEVSAGDPGFGGGQSRDDVARVDLDLSDADVGRLLATTTGVEGFSGGLDRPSLTPKTLSKEAS